MKAAHRSLLAVAALALGACAHRPPPAAYDRAVGLETFDAAWRLVDETYFDTAFGGVDWTALHAQLRPEAERARSVGELRQVIEAMLGRLRRSHFTLVPRERSDSALGRAGPAARGSVGLDVRLLDGRVVVTRVEPGGAATGAGIRPGWVVVTVGHDSAAALVRRARAAGGIFRVESEAWARVARALAAPPDSAVVVGLLDGADRPVRARLVSVAPPGEAVRLGNLPTVFVRFEHERVAGPGGASVGVLRFSGWMTPIMPRLDAAVDSFRAVDGVVVDLRGNTGGMGAMVAGVAGHFLERRDTLALMRDRRNLLAVAANPRLVSADARPVRPFSGPLAVLVDELTASASEVFAGGMQALGRARVFGSRSMGAVQGAEWARLPNGDVLYHAVMSISLPRGGTLEGDGVAPDEPVAPTRGDLLAGRDPVMDAAVRWIATQTRGASR